MTHARPRRWTGFPKPILFCIGVATLSLGIPAWGQFVYVVYENPNLTNYISAYSIYAPTGQLTPVPGSPFPTAPGPPAMAVDPVGKFLYVANGYLFVRPGGSPGTISGYSINNGVLTPVPGSPFPATDPEAIAVDPTGRFVYVTSPNTFANHNPGVSGYEINPTTGVLTLIAGSPFAAGQQPLFVAVDPKGNFVYVASVDGVYGYAIDSTTGALSAVPGSPFSTGAFPPGSSYIAVDPAGRYLYATSAFGLGGIKEFTINATTGALTVAPGPFSSLADIMNMAVDPTGKFLYATTGHEAIYLGYAIEGYSIDAGTGVLTALPGSPFNTGATYSPLLAIDPGGNFVYVSNFTDDNMFLINNVSGFSINATTGGLTLIPGSPWPEPGVSDGITALVVANFGATTPQLGVSVTPNSGSGASQVFAFQYSDSKGYLSLTNAFAGFGATAYVEHSCRVEYYRALNKLYLKNDDGTVFMGPLTPGVAGTLSNSQCTLDSGKSSVSESGDTLTLNLAFSFQPSFAGMQGIYMYSNDVSGQTPPGRQSAGTWNVPN